MGFFAFRGFFGGVFPSFGGVVLPGRRVLRHLDGGEELALGLVDGLAIFNIIKHYIYILFGNAKFYLILSLFVGFTNFHCPSESARLE